jgi:hypothetical protein
MTKPQIVLASPEDERFKKTFFLVEASSFEKHRLWEMWRERVSWEQDSMGCMGQIGVLDNRPVTLSIFWAQINGQLIGFWESPSQVTDSAMAERWFALNCMPPKWDKGTRNARCDAQNFHLCVQAIQEANEREPSFATP